MNWHRVRTAAFFTVYISSLTWHASVELVSACNKRQRCIDFNRNCEIQCVTKNGKIEHTAHVVTIVTQEKGCVCGRDLSGVLF